MKTYTTKGDGLDSKPGDLTILMSDDEAELIELMRIARVLAIELEDKGGHPKQLLGKIVRVNSTPETIELWIETVFEFGVVKSDYKPDGMVLCFTAAV